jgi:hypothetical protein
VAPTSTLLDVYRFRFRVIPSRRGPTVSREPRANVNPASIIFTDDWQAYKPLRGEFIAEPGALFTQPLERAVSA